MNILQTVATCAVLAFVGATAGKWTWARFTTHARPTLGNCIAYGISNACTAAWASALAVALLKV